MTTDRRCAFGCVAIAERHLKKGTEHENMMRKSDMGARWFISQAIYNSAATIALLNDYGTLCRRRGVPPCKVSRARVRLPLPSRGDDADALPLALPTGRAHVRAVRPGRALELDGHVSVDGQLASEHHVGEFVLEAGRVLKPGLEVLAGVDAHLMVNGHSRVHVCSKQGMAVWEDGDVDKG